MRYVSRQKKQRKKSDLVELEKRRRRRWRAGNLTDFDLKWIRRRRRRTAAAPRTNPPWGIGCEGPYFKRDHAGSLLNFEFWCYYSFVMKVRSDEKNRGRNLLRTKKNLTLLVPGQRPEARAETRLEPPTSYLFMHQEPAWMYEHNAYSRRETKENKLYIIQTFALVFFVDLKFICWDIFFILCYNKAKSMLIPQSQTNSFYLIILGYMYIQWLRYDLFYKWRIQLYTAVHRG